MITSTDANDTAYEEVEVSPDAPSDNGAPSPEAEAPNGVPEPEEVEEVVEVVPPQVYGRTGKITGRVYTLEELEGPTELQEREEGDRTGLLELIEPTLVSVSKGEIVPGRVVSVGDKEVLVDIGFKSDGSVSRNEFSEEVEAGTEIEVFLERIEDYHGQLVLSKTKADHVRRWETVVSAFENGTVLEGVVLRRIKGGMIVDLIDGLEAFLPGSQVDVRPVRDFDAYLDRRMEFKVVKINESNENVVVSHKALIEKELKAQRDKILETMETGQILQGTVKNVTDFGVFVDLGGVDGLLHITDLSWGRVAHPTEVVSLDEELKVVVLDYEKERQRISLGLKQLLPHPWDEVASKMKKGDIVEGKVVSIADYGAFVEIAKGVEGLVHISEMSWTGHIRHPSQKVSLGQMVQVSVLGLDHDNKKVSLGMKQLEVNPWEGIAERYAPGTVLNGVVRNITHFGVFVEIEPGIDGLVHISDLSWTKKIRHPGELTRKRQEMTVVVLDVDENHRRISLGHKQIETNPWTGLATVYEEGTDHTAKVLRIDKRGVIVELPLEVEAFVPERELRHGGRSIFSAYHEGDKLNLRVIRMDPKAKEIVMSETARERQEAYKRRNQEAIERRKARASEERAVRQYKQRQRVRSGPATLGELSELEDLRQKMRAAENRERRQRSGKRR